MFKKMRICPKFVTILVLLCLIIFGGLASAAVPASAGDFAVPMASATTGATAAQASSLCGVVVEEGLVSVGTVVKEGQVLVMVRTFAGNAPAARASVDGTVVEVLVVPGAQITAGQIVAKIRPY